MADKAEQTQKKGNTGLLIGIIIVLVLVIIAILVFLVWGTSRGVATVADTVADTAAEVADTAEEVAEAIETALPFVESVADAVDEGSSDPISETDFVRNMHLITLRNDDFPDIAYKHISYKRYANEEVIGRMTVEKGKPYILETGRLDGWDTYIEKAYVKDIGPGYYQTRVEIFDSNEGAEIAFSPKYLWVYTNVDRAPDEILDDNCDFGDECLYLAFTKVTPGSTSVSVRWDYVFRVGNVIAWVYVNGSDLETFESDALEAAQIVYDRIVALQ